MPRTIQTFRDLAVWQRAMQLFSAVTRLVRSLPQSERFVFETQIRRATLSVAANIAEGHQRRDLGDYLRHLSYARGSVAEVETHLHAIVDSMPAARQDVDTALGLADEVGRMLTVLNAKLRQRRG